MKRYCDIYIYRIYTEVLRFHFSLSCSIASVTSYLSENEAENQQNGNVHVAQIPDFEIEYLENHLAH